MKKIMTILAAAMLAATGMQGKTIVVYFSATGTTKNAAQVLAKEQNAVLWEIEPAERYTAADLDWRNKQSRSSLEMADPAARPTIKQCTNIQPYDTGSGGTSDHQTMHEHPAVRHYLCRFSYLVGYMPEDHRFVAGE